jgi:hypothetical protein
VLALADGFPYRLRAEKWSGRGALPSIVVKA